ncbi:hypothetical protein AQ611_00970 [Burkholderia singularis]|nr:hypothetical protein AQ611_00970 [Burkholderia sp. Bp7605]
MHFPCAALMLGNDVALTRSGGGIGRSVSGVRRGRRPPRLPLRLLLILPASRRVFLFHFA